MSDLLGRPLGRRAAANPFTPDFGLSPRHLAGRDTILSALEDGLGEGPNQPRFTSVLIGHRGSGKTVLLNEVEDIATQAGWAVLTADATTARLAERIDDELDELEAAAARPSRTRVRADGTQIKLSAGAVSVTQRFAREADKGRPPRSLLKRLEALGRAAAQANSAVLLTVDEIQAGSREELRRLSADLQHIVKRKKLPVAFVGAGLPSVEYTIMRDDKMTFFHRCHQHRVELIVEPSVLAFYKNAIRDAGAACAPAELMRMAQAAAGHPYRMQEIGHQAWTIAGAPDRPIDSDAVTLAIDAAENRMAARVYSHLWETISPADRDILKAVAAQGGAIPRAALGASVSYPASHVVNRLKRLASQGCVVWERGSDVTLGPLAPLSFVADVAEDEDSFAEQSAAVAASAAQQRTDMSGRAQRCGKRLKTIDAHCVLRAGHNGRCRSR